ncbi:hypothetical protein [Ralstonia sp. SET104]|uniref:hypothetical protein n=1 Tax=Ralstonia sp. SET104 TaxID=2448774 RepID=UPI000F567D0F|nr:hypothetical protein [Ralstonia sp. SET104]
MRGIVKKLKTVTAVIVYRTPPFSAILSSAFSRRKTFADIGRRLDAQRFEAPLCPFSVPRAHDLLSID